MSAAAFPAAASAAAEVHPLVAQLLARTGAVELSPSSAASFAEGRGMRVLVFLEDPARYRETLDLAVIVPELVALFTPRLALGVLLPVAARAVAPQYGVRRWPALVVLRDGAYMGAIEGLRAWEEYLQALARLAIAAPSRVPVVGIALTRRGEGPAREV